MTLRTLFIRSSILSISASVALLSGCSSASDDDSAVGDDVGELNVAVCKKGHDLPLVKAEDDYEGAQKHAFGKYTAAHGIKIPFDVPVLSGEGDGEGGGSGAKLAVTGKVPFNPVEFGVEMRALPVGFEQKWIGTHPPDWALEGIDVAFKEGLVLDAAQVEGCLGTVELAANAKVNLGNITDQAKIDWYCAPGSVQGKACTLRDGAPVGATVRSLLMVNGFLVTSDALNFRAGPSTNDTVYETIPKNAIVQLSGHLKNDFYSIKRGSKDGWVHRDFLTAFYGTAVTTDALNVRELPSTQSKVLGLIPKGTRVNAYSTGSGQFMNVYWDKGGAYGFASGVFLKDPKVDPSGD